MTRLRTEVYLRADIANVLAALAIVGGNAADSEWRAGYLQALTAAAAAFGLEPEAWCVVESAQRGRVLAIVQRGA